MNNNKDPEDSSLNLSYISWNDRKDTISSVNSFEIDDKAFYNKCISKAKDRNYFDVSYDGKMYFLKTITKEELEKLNYAKYYTNLKLVNYSHDHIISLVSLFEHNDVIFFAYEKGDMTLLDYIRKFKPDIKEKLQISLDIAQGLQTLHNIGIAHMDLKLENIMKFGNKFKVIDLESSVDFTNMPSEDLCIKSSLDTMPPELYEWDVEKFGLSIDLWSYGLIFYELMTEKSLIEANNQEDGLDLINSMLANLQFYLKKLKWHIAKYLNSYNFSYEQYIKLESNVNEMVEKLIEKTFQKDPRSRGNINEIVQIIMGIVSLLKK